MIFHLLQRVTEEDMIRAAEKVVESEDRNKYVMEAMQLAEDNPGIDILCINAEQIFMEGADQPYYLVGASIHQLFLAMKIATHRTLKKFFLWGSIIFLVIAVITLALALIFSAS